MANFSGYVLEKPRVGAANSPFTASPDNLISSQSSYNSVYGTDESDPGRTEYLVLSLVDGDLADAEFGWTKNEGGIQRFDYDGQGQRFRPLPGSSRAVVGVLDANANTTRLKVAPPTVSVSVAPIRVSVGSIGSGTTFPAILVPNDAAFTTPPVGRVQISLDTGNLNWHPNDLLSQDGQTVYFQRQNHFGLKESTGALGDTNDVLCLNPIPSSSSRKPLIRFGFGMYLSPVSVTNEGAFSVNPVQGTVEWARDTGRLRFNSTDLANNAGETVYYDGVLYQTGKTVSRETIGTVTSPSVISSLPSEGADLIFRAKKSGAPTGTATFLSTSVLQDGAASFVSDKVKVGDIVVLGTGARRQITAVSNTQLTVAPPFPSVASSSYTVEKKADIYQFTSAVRVSSLTSPGQADVVQVDDSGNVQFSDADQAKYGSRTAEFLSGDLLIERGISLRLFRNPVDLNAKDPDLKDVSTFYPVPESVLADPIIAQPTVYLPVLPIDDPAYPLVVQVEQGTGTFTGVLPRLDVGSPPAGYGYTLDFDGRQIVFAARKNATVVAVPGRSAAVQLPDPLVEPSNATFELNQGAGYVPLTNGVDALLEPTSGVVTFISQQGTVLAEGTGTVATPTMLQDLSADFVAAGVAVGDFVVVPAGPLKGVYTISSFSTTDLNVDPDFPGVATGVPYEVRSGKEVLADRFWQEIALVDPLTVVERIRSNVTTQLVQGVDYILSPDLGLIQFRERMLALDEIRITYASANDPENYTQERATFLVRKEITTHSTPASNIPFNPSGRTVATNPAPSVYRGGRPQTSDQVQINSSSITFLPDVIPTSSGALVVTDALPHGPIVQPTENVYIDYYVYEALGGENTIQVLNPPINLAKVAITDGESSFDIIGDWTQEFQANRLMRIEQEQVYYITSVTYDGSKTTVTVSGTFRDSFSDPKIYISSGDISLTPPSYFVLESASYDAVPRGMNLVKVQGDKSLTYVAGTILYFSGTGFQEFYQVTGAKYNADTDRTEISITQAVARQYQAPGATLRRSVRPIFESTATTVRTSESPLVMPPATTVADSVVVFRQTSGSPGVILIEGTDFKIDDSGKIDLATPLQPEEEVSIFYTRYRFVTGNLRASYTASISPSDQNGLLNQKLTASFTTFTPDSFFFRVETMTNFRAEVAQDYKDEATSSSPSGGPRTSNSSTPKLYEQGVESVFFTEGHLANEDIIARATLEQYNDAVNYLEDLLQNMDGRVVGDYDGKFKFDGSTGAVRSSFASAHNQIDDKFKLSKFPIDPTPPLFPLKYLGTYLKAYQPSTSSRFFPTFRNRFGYTIAGDDTNAKTKDEILDFQAKNLTGSTNASRRSPRALLTRSAKAGDVTIYVDTTAKVDTAPYRPAFANSQKVVVQGPDGTFYVHQGSPLTISSKSSTSLTFSAGLPVDVPLGATVYLADSDTAYRKTYRVGFDVTLDVDKGYLLYVKPYPPYDGSVPAVPAELQVQAPDSNELLEAGLYLNNQLTAPDRFPALDGQPLDDDGDQRLPLINPTSERELGAPGYLETELTYIQPSGLLLSNSVSPFVGTGNLNGAGTVITLASGSFPSPVPQVGDLVRTLSGSNGASDFRRVISVSANSVNVDVAFPSAPDTGFSFLVTAAANLVSGSFTTAVGAVVTDTTANYITAGVKPGHTVILTQVGNLSRLERRQVKSVDSATQITLTAAFSNPVALAAYRISNSLSTYSDTGDLPSAPAGLLDILQDNTDSEVNSIDNFFETLFTDRLSPSSASGSVSGTTLTGVSVDFMAAGVLPGDFVYVTPTQSNQGFYLVEEVTGPTTLKVTDAFPGSGSVTFRVVSSFAASEQTLSDLFEVRANAVSFYSSSTAWASLVSSAVPVRVPPGVVDSTYFARGYTSSDFSARVTTINARKAYIPSAISKVEAALASSDRFYDKRYVWIDARINLEKGILVKQERAVANRIKAQAETLKQLTKLLAVE